MTEQQQMQTDLDNATTHAIDPTAIRIEGDYLVEHSDPLMGPDELDELAADLSELLDYNEYPIHVDAASIRPHLLPFLLAAVRGGLQ